MLKFGVQKIVSTYSLHFCSFYLFLLTPPSSFKVAGVVGRADLLGALFFLLSFLGYCKAFRESKHDVCLLSFEMGKYSFI